MAIQEISPPNRFGSDFRLGRINNAISRYVDISSNEGNIIFQQGVHDNLQVVISQPKENALHTINIGIYHLYLDTLRRGDYREALRARAAFIMFRQFVNPASEPNGIPILEAPNTDGDMKY